MYKFYEVDPDADTLLVIPNPSKPFAPWQQENSPPTSSSAEDASSVYAGILRGTSRPPNIYASIASSPETRVKVSSKHLALASKHFRNKFRHLGPEETQADGRFHVTLGGYDPAAVLIVMDAVHGRGTKVPKAVELETLAKVAVFVDAFRCFEAVEVYAERWFERLGNDAPAVYGRDLVLWMYACYVFRQSQAFTRATKIAVLNSDGLLRTLGLQVRAGVVSKCPSSHHRQWRIWWLTPRPEEIDVQRQQLVRRALDVVHSAVDTLQEDGAPCSFGCDTFTLGALIKNLHRADLVWPRPSKPFLGVSFAQILEAVDGAQAQVAQFVPGLSLNGSGMNNKSRKRKSPNAQPGQALTPESSPEARATFDAHEHECAARGDGLSDRLHELEVEVKGLELESKLGYYLY